MSVRVWSPDHKHAAEIIRRALVLLADHELNASTFTVRCAASTGLNLYDSVIAGLVALKGPRHDRWIGIRCQDHWNDRTTSPVGLVEKSYDLPGLPLTNPVGAEENSRSFYSFNLLPNYVVPVASGSDVRFIQPRIDVFPSELLRDLANSWLVLAVVAQEDIKDLGLKVLPVHANAVL